jgi:hypothetical protein
MVRATAVFTTVGFVLASRYTRLSFTHRALGAMAAAAVAVTALFGLLGLTWDEVAWWVEHRTRHETQLMIGPLRGLGGGGVFDQQVDAWIAASTEFASRCFPALLGLQLLGGLALGTSLHHRVATRPVGTPLGRLSEFRFTEHLGWAAAIPLLILLIPRLAAAKIVATNFLVLTGALYALRGAAVALFGAGLAGNTTLAMFLIAGAALFMLPVMLAAAVLLGVLDAGLDLRRRWSKPPAGN